MSKVNFIFCTHNLQPVGNFGWVFEKAYQVSYKPFMLVMLKHPKIRWSMHASGMLWEYISKEHPDYIKSVKKLVSTGNLEILSGGYYEPIMTAIPDRDKIGQIKKLTCYLKNKFGCEEANGAWLAERVWEPGFAKVLCEAGIDYTVLDDAHFVAAGMDADGLKGYYTTEEQGCRLNIFPISQRLRYLIPFQNVENTINYFKSIAAMPGDSNHVLVMADDGEKFGMWPGTNKHVYENGWLENFLTAIEENFDIAQTASFSEILKTCSPSGRVYLPCASYFEMSEWSLPSDAQQKFENVLARYGGDNEARAFLRGGFWRNFLSKYEESNNMHKKMLYVGAKIKKYVDGKKPFAEKALDSLYAGQCNCAYWHGVFGGLYLPHLRNAVYKSLLKAENIYNKSCLKRPAWTVFDFDCDAQNEYLYESKTHNIYVKADLGGGIFEFDILKINHNLLDVLTRRYESYHKRLRDNSANAVIANDNEQEVHTIHDNEVKVKEAGLEKYLSYDWHRKISLADHFIASDTKHEDFAFARFKEEGDFVLGKYKAKISSSKLILERCGKVAESGVNLVKTIIPSKSGYYVSYEIKNISRQTLDLCFAPEQVFAFSSKTGDDNADLKDISAWKRYDDFLKIEVEIKFSEKCDIWVYPIETVSNSENGYEKTYQGTSAAPLIRKSLNPDESFKFEMETAVNIKV
jgi:alpha-amylase